MNKTFTFAALPKNLAQLQALPEAVLADPFQTAALTVCALCVFAEDKAAGTEMLNWLRGPRPLSNYDISFLNDRFRDGKYVIYSYFAGATPDNNYTPAQPYTLTFEAGPYADANPGYKKLLKAKGNETLGGLVYITVKPDPIYYSKRIGGRHDHMDKNKRND